MNRQREQPVDVTVFVGGLLVALLIAGTGFVIYRAGQPYSQPPQPWDHCELVRVVKTEDRKYCGKACSMPVYADTYRCPAGEKTWLNARWDAK